jgi:starch synthase
MLTHIDWQPQIIHCSDFQTALVPVYYNLFYKQKYPNIKIVFTIHNIAFQGKYGFEVLDDVLGVPAYYRSIMEYDGCVNLIKAAIETADKITTLSPSYAMEVVESDELSFGLSPVLRAKLYKFTGFLYGIDTNSFNPATDRIIAANYSANNLSGKHKCKKALLARLNLAPGDEPLIGMVGQLVEDKGHDLIMQVFEQMVADGYKFAIHGVGNYRYESFYREMTKKYPDRVSATLTFSSELSRHIYAGSDMFLMPSLYAVSGFLPMVNLRYGTVPIVHEIGGLKDTVSEDFNVGKNGFTFSETASTALLYTTRRAHEEYKNKKNWENLVRYDMGLDYSLSKTAELYLGMYRELVG